jgi:hypothetical protein
MIRNNNFEEMKIYNSYIIQQEVYITNILHTISGIPKPLRDEDFKSFFYSILFMIQV